MEDRELALKYAPIIYFDSGETVFPRAVGYTIFTRTARSASFPGREVPVPEGARVPEYAYYYDYDIEHMYDLEHIWVTVDGDGKAAAAQGSFHGKYLEMLIPGLHGALAPEGNRVQVFCQPGKHAFLPAGDLARIVPGWERCCLEGAGGPVLIGNPFSAKYAPEGKDLFIPRPEDDEHSRRYLREKLAFRPTLQYVRRELDPGIYRTWKELYELIPEWIRAECRRLERLYGD